MPGRKPKPPELKLITGNPGKRPVKPVVHAPGALSTPLAWLTDDQKAAWRYAIKNAPLGLLRRVDRGALTAYIVAEDLHHQAAMKVAEFGMLTKTPRTGEPMQSPYLPIVNRQALIMMKCASELGFTPVARARVEVPDGDKEDEESNPAAKYFD